MKDSSARTKDGFIVNQEEYDALLRAIERLTHTEPQKDVEMESTTGAILDPKGIDHPKHYNVHPSGIEAIQIIRYFGFNTGSAFKYLFRADHKGQRQADLQKALWYIEDEIKRPTKSNWNKNNHIEVWKKLLNRVIESEKDDFIKCCLLNIGLYEETGYIALLSGCETILSIYIKQIKNSPNKEVYAST